MKNIFKIIFILCLGMFVVTGCADNSSGGNGGGNTENTGGDNIGNGGNTGNGGDNNGDGDNTGEVYTPEFTKLISLGGLSYGETADGKRYVWGNAGELAGIGNEDEVTTPVKVDLTVIDNITNDDTYYVITDKGLYAWGNNEYGQVGNGESGYEKGEDGEVDYSKPKQVLTPHKVEGITGNIKEVITDGGTVYVLTDIGLFAWGANGDGQVGNNGTTENVLTPHKVNGIDGTIKEVKTDGGTVYVLTDIGLFAWGYNKYGQVGNGTTNNVLLPHKVDGITGNIEKVIIGSTLYDGNTVYVITDKGLYAWGANGDGQVGNGELGRGKNVPNPYKVEEIDGNIKKVILLSYNPTVYVLTDTGLYAWGNNSYGQVGDGTTNKVLTPYKVDGIDGNIKDLMISGSGTSATYYVLTDTGLYAWGNNSYGQVGDGTTNKVLTPYKVDGIDGNIKDLIISGYDTFVTYYVLTDTGLYAWGYNRDGQAGNGTTENVPNPYKVQEITGNIKEVKTDGGTVYVLTDIGLFAWGANGDGQVGNGTTENVKKPYKVEGIDGNIKDLMISGSGTFATYYVLTDTGLYAWGNNSYGQVGNGTTDNVLTPHKAVEGNIKEFITPDYKKYGTYYYTYYYTYYALTDTGLFAWGHNEYGQVGNGESGYEKDENGNNDYAKPKKVLTPYKVQIKKQN